MKIVNLEINNILSIENASIDFGDSGLVLVEGYDYDSNRANGAGKSSIFNALSFALFDKVPRGITKSEILRNTTKKGFASATIRSKSGDATYTVKRSRPSRTTFFKDDEEVDMTQEEFENIIGMNYEQFLITMYTAQDSNDKFMYLNDSGKKNFILKIMNLDSFSKYKQDVASQVKTLELEQSNINGRIEGLKSNIEIYKSSLVDKKSIEDKITQNNKDIDFYKNKIKDLQQIPKPDLSKYDELETKLIGKLSQINSASVLRQQALIEFNRYNSMIRPFNPKDPDASCPVCSADLNIQGSTLAKADDIEALKKQHEAHMQELEDIKKEYKAKIDEHDKVILQESQVKETLQKLKDKKMEESYDYAAAGNQISEYSNSISIKKVDNTNLNIQLNKNQDIKVKIAEIVKEATSAKDRLSNIEQELSVLKVVEGIFDNTGAPAYIMDSIVDSFNETVSDYICEIWPNASYSLQTYKENKDKSIKAKFSETLTINGKDRSIGSLSGGEKRALSLALDFSIIEVLASKYSLELNPIILDEPFNGLDSAGRELVIEILERFAENRQIWVVDHASEAKSMFSKIIRVEKRNGISVVI
jgi:DNA repair exonuclease SbcCD ATPase subunit